MIFFRSLMLGLLLWGITSHLLPTLVLYRIFMGLGAMSFLVLWVYASYVLLEALERD